MFDLFFVFVVETVNHRHAVLAVRSSSGIPFLRAIKKKKCPSDYWSVNNNVEASFVLFSNN